MYVLLGVPVGAAYHLVSALTQLLTPVAGGLAAAAAIVLFTAAVRLAISPLSLRALRGQAAMARLAPQVQALRARFGRQPERFSSELTALYKREGASPLASFWPLLAQWPVLSVMYLLFRSATVDGAQNRLLSRSLFGVPLGEHWLSGASLLSAQDALFLAVFAVLAALCWLSARLARRTAPAAPPAANAAAASTARRATQVPAGTTRARQSRGGTGQAAGGTGQAAGGTGQAAGGKRAGTARPAANRVDPAEALADSKAVAWVTRVLPYLTVVIAAFAPLATAIYLLTTVAWTIAERRLFLRSTMSLRGTVRAEPAPGASLPEPRKRPRAKQGPDNSKKPAAR
jgi:YidC/Oxa1 family membrane protein insertase